MVTVVSVEGLWYVDKQKRLWDKSRKDLQESRQGGQSRELRQLLPPPQVEEESEEDSDGESVIDITQDRRERVGERRRVKAPKSGLCGRLLWFVCVVLFFGVCVVFCSVLLLVSLPKVSIVFHK